MRAKKASLLAALGRERDAMAELGLLERAHLAYAHLESTRRSVHLIAAARRADFAIAAVIARAREDELFVNLREEVLGELVRLASGEPFSRERRERVRNEIDEQAELRRWLARAAPTALEALVGSAA